MADINRRLSFEDWMKEADKYAWAKYGLSVHDLDDYMWRDAYEDGKLPTAAARAARKRSGS